MKLKEIHFSYFSRSIMSVSGDNDDIELSRLSTKRYAIEEFTKKKDASFGDKVKKFLKRRIFVLSWIRDYDRSMAVRDLIAGVTLGLTMVPQSLAYANLANVPAQYGLYSAFMGSLVYVVLGTVKEVSIGPTSLMSIITISYTFEKPVEYVIVLTFLAGCVEFLMGVFKLGFIVDFISAPVVSSFSTSTSLIIIGAQLKNLLGIKFSAKNFPTTILKLVQNIADIKFGDAAVGAFAIMFLLFLKNIKDIKLSPDRPSTGIIKKVLFYLSLSRNAVIVLITSYFAYLLTLYYDQLPFRLSEKVTPGLPAFNLPEFSVNKDNRTVGFFEICSDIGSGLLLLPLVSILANVAIAKAFSKFIILTLSRIQFSDRVFIFFSISFSKSFWKNRRCFSRNGCSWISEHPRSILQIDSNVRGFYKICCVKFERGGITNVWRLQRYDGIISAHFIDTIFQLHSENNACCYSYLRCFISG